MYFEKHIRKIKSPENSNTKFKFKYRHKSQTKLIFVEYKF